MKSTRILLLLAGLVVSAFLAFFLQDVIRRMVVTPLAYLWWALKLLYSAIPQLLLWILLLTALTLIIISSLLDWYPIGKKEQKPIKPVLGPVETLAGWISKIEKGNYYKWMIANRLGKLRGEIHDRPGNQDRAPSEAVQRYLIAGLGESFVDYPLQRRPFVSRRATPFDLDVEEAVEFLESQMEASSGRKHS